MTYAQLQRHIKRLAATVRAKDQIKFEAYLGGMGPAQAALAVECLSHEISGGDHPDIEYDKFYAMLSEAAG